MTYNNIHLADQYNMSYYYFAIASQEFLTREEPVEEILRERTNHYQAIGKEIDFWFVIDPAFLYTPQMENIKKQIQKPAAAIVSLNPQFIEWLKLRISFIIIGDFQCPSEQIPDAVLSMNQ